MKWYARKIYEELNMFKVFIIHKMPDKNIHTYMTFIDVVQLSIVTLYVIPYYVPSVRLFNNHNVTNKKRKINEKPILIRIKSPRSFDLIEHITLYVHKKGISQQK